MSRRARFAATLSVAAVLASLVAGVVASATPPVEARPTGLTVHEWGTFTSVASPDDGQAVSWYPLSGPSDLPCFVRVLGTTGVKSIVGGLPAVSATVRMETPVIYFYAERDLTARVSVRFPQGLISEWYPAATVSPVVPADAADANGSITWPSVKITPGAAEVFPREPGDSHYYPARETDAVPISVAGQQEKFLFYRGIAGFPVTVRARIGEDGRLVVSNTGERPVAQALLFQNLGGRIGYRMLPALSDETAALAMPELTAGFAGLAADLIRMLVAEGLYEREARAMVETWRDSWFEEGTRLIYLVPRADVDRILPLSVSPAPDAVVRAFIGRVEIITPAMQDDVEQALLNNDLAALNRCGRFLQPIVDSIRSRPSLAGMQGRIDHVLRLIAAGSTPEVICPAGQ